SAGSEIYSRLSKHELAGVRDPRVGRDPELGRPGLHGREQARRDLDAPSLALDSGLKLQLPTRVLVHDRRGVPDNPAVALRLEGPSPMPRAARVNVRSVV